MSTTSDFYQARAADCLREAEATGLDNVRERFERSAEAWQAMADRITLTEAARADRK